MGHQRRTDARCGHQPRVGSGVGAGTGTGTGIDRDAM